MPVVARDALRGRLLKAFCRCPGSLGAARRLRLFCFSKYLSITKWFDVVSFSATSTCISLPLLSLYTPVDRRSFWQTLSASIFNDIAWLLCMQIININMISMNYENVCRYLCFCCVDAVDYGVGRRI